MRYDILGELRRAEARVTVEVDAPPPEGTGLNVLAPITGALTLANTGYVIAAQGALRARIVTECSRCLASLEVELDIPVNEVCSLTQIDEPPPEAVGEQDAPIPILDEGTVDLSELVRQLLMVHAPSRSLCRPGCRGLCPTCGRDLNEGPCRCSEEQIDPRLAGLKKLLS